MSNQTSDESDATPSYNGIFVDIDTNDLGKPGKWPFSNSRLCPLRSCKATFPSRAPALKHFREAHSQFVKMCKICCKPVAKRYCERHYARYHAKDNTVILNQIDLEQVRQLTLTNLSTTCTQYFVTKKKSFMSIFHKSLKEPEPKIQCSFCNNQYASQMELNQHVDAIHSIRAAPSKSPQVRYLSTTP